MEVDKISPKVLRIDQKIGRSYEQWFLLTSDRHWDNPKSNWDLQKKHLEEAKARDAYVLDFGDLFCAMQGKYDKRSDKKDVRPEHQVTNYLDALVTTAADFFAPYADRIIQVSPGNHESSISKKHETNLLERFCALLYHKTGQKVHLGTYAGWVQFGFQRAGENHLVVLHYDHGYGGGGAVTKGVIQSQRRSTYLPDAHIVVSGHVHESYLMVFMRERLGHQGTPYLEEQTHICLPTYKEEYLPGEGWHIETGKPPKPLGAWWLRFSYNSKYGKIDYELTQAK